MISKPTSYRRERIIFLENNLAEACEEDRVLYRKNFLVPGNLRHLQALEESKENIKPAANDGIRQPNQSKQFCESRNVKRIFSFRFFFHLKTFTFHDIPVRNSTLTNFDISKSKIRTIRLELYIRKTKGPNWYPPAFFAKLGSGIIRALHVMLKNTKRLRKITTCWKTAAVTLIQKKIKKYLLRNYRPISLLNIDSKMLENVCMMPCTIISQNFSPPVNTDLLYKNPQSRTFLFCKRFTKRLTKIVAVKFLPFILIFPKLLIRCLTLNCYAK